MATSMLKNVQNIFSKKIPNIFSITDSISQLRVTTQLDFVRGKRRSSAPRPWWTRRKPAFEGQNFQFTPENKEFLDEVISDKFTGGYDLETPLKDLRLNRENWTRKTFRTGALGIKLGVYPHWEKDGKKFQTTLLQIIDNHVINYIPPEEVMRSDTKATLKTWKGKYGITVIGALSCDPHRFHQSYNNLFLKAGVIPKRKLTRFKVSPSAALMPGTPITVNHWRVGDRVDVQSKTIGHGFQGVVKRWGMKGGPASHGSTKFHRKMGSTGGGGAKSRIWKGKKMPGHMGMEWRSIKGVEIVRINTKYNILFLRGPCMPGPNHSYMRIMDTCLPLKRIEMEKAGNHPPMPTCYEDDSKEDLPEDIYIDNVHKPMDPTIRFVD